jgi:hypothetical protein
VAKRRPTAGLEPLRVLSTDPVKQSTLQAAIISTIDPTLGRRDNLRRIAPSITR